MRSNKEQMMSKQEYRFQTSVEPGVELLEGLGVTQEAGGWGVFDNSDGLAQASMRELVSVHDEQADANREAARLNEEKGSIEHEVSSDPESNIWSQRWFDVARVVGGPVLRVLVERTYTELK